MPLGGKHARERTRRSVLLIDQQPGMCHKLKEGFAGEGYQVLSPATPSPTPKSVARTDPDLIILGNVARCRSLREHGITAPIIIVGPPSGDQERIAGLKAGADDSLTEPFSIGELLARAEAILRRVRPDRTRKFSFGDVWVDFDAFEARKAGRAMELSPLEFEILHYLVENRERVIRRSEMLQQVWGYDSTTHTRTIDTHIANLRQKIGDDSAQPHYILTIHGIGYRFKAM